MANIHRAVGVSDTIGTQVRQGWHQLDGRLADGETLVVGFIDRIGQHNGRRLHLLWSLITLGTIVRRLPRCGVDMPSITSRTGKREIPGPAPWPG